MNWKKIADFYIRMVIVFVTFISLVFYAEIFDKSALVFAAIGILYLIALIVKGITDVNESR